MPYITLKDFIKHIRYEFKYCFNLRKFKKDLENKSIAIVGNAASLLEYEYGAAIDKHDIVIRINKGFINSPKAQGRKTTVYCTSISIEEETLLKEFRNMEYLIWLSPKITNMCSYTEFFKRNLLVYPLHRWLKLFLKLKARPTSGIMLIDYINKNINFSNLDIYGFDFFHSNSISNEISLNELKKITPHNFSYEKEFIELPCSKNNKINIQMIQTC